MITTQQITAAGGKHAIRKLFQDVFADHKGKCGSSCTAPMKFPVDTDARAKGFRVKVTLDVGPCGPASLQGVAFVRRAVWAGPDTEQYKFLEAFGNQLGILLGAKPVGSECGHTAEGFWFAVTVS